MIISEKLVFQRLFISETVFAPHVLERITIEDAGQYRLQVAAGCFIALRPLPATSGGIDKKRIVHSLIDHSNL